MEAEREVAILYELCQSLSPPTERLLLRSLKTEIRVTLWRHHLTKHLSRADLSDAQRAVIDEGLHLLLAAPSAVSNQDEPGSRLAKRRLRQHRRRAEAVFSPESIIEIFFTFRSRDSIDQNRHQGTQGGIGS